jgi:peroxiredoxin
MTMTSMNLAQPFRLWLMLLALACTSARAPAAEPGVIEFNQVLKIGAACPAWTDLPGTDEQKHSLAELKDVPVVVVVFTCNTCPTATDYEERILAAIKHNDSTHPGKVKLVAINCNKVTGDTLPDMIARAKEKSLTYLYLHDETQQIAKQYGAITTPQFFVLDAARKLVYTGALDDATDPKVAKVNYLQAAIDAALAGKTPEVTNIPPRGCLIRFARERKK